MASIYDLKPRFQQLLRPLVGGLVSVGVTPNMVTMAALAGSVMVGARFLGAGPAPWLWLPFWLFARMALNAIDGMMAREHNMRTTFGAIINELGDVLSDTALYLPLAVALPTAAPHIVVFTLLSALTEFCGVLAQALTGTRRYEGPMGKSDRAFVVSVTALLLAFIPGALNLVPAIFSAASLAAVATCYNRLK